MQIKIFTPVSDSTVDNKILSAFPEAIQQMLISPLTSLKEEGVVTVEAPAGAISQEAIVLARRDDHIRLERFLIDPSVKQQFVEVIEFLAWYIGPKFRYLGRPGTMGGGSSCISCSRTVNSGVRRCPDWKCKSHVLWKKVDPNYKVPEQPKWERIHESDLKRMGKAIRANPGATVSLDQDTGLVTVVEKGKKTKKIRRPKEQKAACG